MPSGVGHQRGGGTGGGGFPGRSRVFYGGRNNVLRACLLYTSSERKKRDPHEIGISAVRGGSIVGEHEVIFAGLDEVIEFKHTAYSRSVFGKGAVEAAKFLAGKEAGFYDMQDVIRETMEQAD